jgi:hypothetical protein
MILYGLFIGSPSNTTGYSSQHGFPVSGKSKLHFNFAFCILLISSTSMILYGLVIGSLSSTTNSSLSKCDFPGCSKSSLYFNFALFAIIYLFKYFLLTWIMFCLQLLCGILSAHPLVLFPLICSWLLPALVLPMMHAGKGRNSVHIILWGHFIFHLHSANAGHWFNWPRYSMT